MAYFTALLKRVGKQLGYSLIPSIGKGFRVFREKAKGVPFRDKVSDFVSVIRNVWFFLLFICLAILAFTQLPQGKDIILLVVEEVGVDHSIWNLVWLLVGLTFWSVISEYGARYSIYVADNSGKNLPEKRVEWRKAIQKTVALGFFALPFLSILFSLVVLYFNDQSLPRSQRNWGFGLTFVAVYMVFANVSKAYFDRDLRRRRRAEREKSWFWRLFLISPRELAYAEKLYGIYNHYIFSLPKESWFREEYNSSLRRFYDHFRNEDGSLREETPQNLDKEKVLTDAKAVDESFVLDSTDSNSIHPFRNDEADIADNPNGFYRWEYRIPASYFRNLHRQLTILSLFSLFIILVFSFGSTGFYQFIGSPALVFFAFAAWSGVYLGLLFLDKGVMPRFPVSLRLILFVWVIFCSITNNDHPVRMQGEATCGERPELGQHFRNWMENYTQDTQYRYYRIPVKDGRFRYATASDTAVLKLSDSARKAAEFYPVTFVCAEGGALRTAGFTALALANIRDTLLDLHYDFDKTIYAMSGVSGGALGLGYFNAISYLSKPGELKYDSSETMALSFFREDYLAPTLGKLLYGDVINLVMPFSWKIDRFDRAIGLERSWEHGYQSILAEQSANVFSSDFRALYCERNNLPALFINTTEVESGLQCWVTNVRADSLPLAKQRDLLQKKIRGNIPYSTAINFSSRFPLISPGAMVPLEKKRKLHYVDGGYVENTGAATMIEILDYIRRDTVFGKKIRPTVLVLKFSSGGGTVYENMNFMNEVTEIVSGIYNTRGGRSAIAEANLRKMVETEMDGAYVPFSLKKNAVEVPLNWTLSNKSLQNINADIKDQLGKSGAANVLNKLAFFR